MTKVALPCRGVEGEALRQLNGWSISLFDRRNASPLQGYLAIAPFLQMHWWAVPFYHSNLDC